MVNTVLDSTRGIIENPDYVFIDNKEIKRIARKFAQEEFIIPDWSLPIYPELMDNTTVDFIFLENTINFAFTDFKTKKKFATYYKGREWKGAMAMAMCLKRALDNGIPIFNPNFLANIRIKKMKDIFKGNIKIPMLEERQEIFHEVGKILSEKYQGHFYNLVEEAGNRLFNDGKGLVELLTNNFPNFDDSVILRKGKARFDKRAQLATAILYGKFQNTDSFKFEDIDDLTVFADYVLPKGLRDLGILKYDDSLEKKVDNQILIPASSKEELEIRASTIHSAQMLIEEINKYRKSNINALHMDYKLWSEARKNAETHHHLTKTIAY